MSVTICWRPKSEKPNHFANGTSNGLTKLRKVFAETVSTADIPALRAMAIATDDGFYAEVADVVEKVGDIEVWGEY